MNLRPGTIFFLASLVAAIALYDAIALWRGGGRATISSVILTASYTPPYGLLIPLAVGVVLGHVFLPQRPP